MKVNLIYNVMYNLKKKKNTHGVVLLFSKACNFTKSNTCSWVFFPFFKLYKWYQLRNAPQIITSNKIL